MQDVPACHLSPWCLLTLKQGEQGSKRQRKKDREQQETFAEQLVKPQEAVHSPEESTQVFHWTGTHEAIILTWWPAGFSSLIESSFHKCFSSPIPLPRDFCICLSLLLLAVSSYYLCTASHTSTNTNSLSLSLVMYRSASLLHLSQWRPVPLTPPRRHLPTSWSPAWWEQSCSADSPGMYRMASVTCCLSHRHP